MASSVSGERTLWRDYVASAYLRRIRSGSTDFDPGKGAKIYRRYDYTIEVVGRLTAARRT